MKTINVTIKGTQPLLQHRMQIDVLHDSATNTKGPRLGAPKGDDPEKYLYKDSNGVICQPGEHIYQAIVKKLSNFQIAGKGKKTYKELGQGCIRIVPEMIPHKNTKWIPDARTVVVNRGRIVRIRPRFNDWELDFQIKILNEAMPESVVKQCLSLVGAQGGIGDYRPLFGLFEVTKFEELKN